MLAWLPDKTAPQRMCTCKVCARPAVRLTLCRAIPARTKPDTSLAHSLQRAIHVRFNTKRSLHDPTNGQPCSASVGRAVCIGRSFPRVQWIRQVFLTVRPWEKKATFLPDFQIPRQFLHALAHKTLTFSKVAGIIASCVSRMRQLTLWDLSGRRKVCAWEGMKGHSE